MEKREIYLTGDDSEAYDENTESKCYLCKRKEGSKNIFIEDAHENASSELELRWYKVEAKSFILRYLLCIECYFLIDNFRTELGEMIQDKFMTPFKPSRN